MCESRFDAGPRSRSVCEGRAVECTSGSDGGCAAGVEAVGFGSSVGRCSSWRLIDVDSGRLNRGLLRIASSAIELCLAFRTQEGQVHCCAFGFALKLRLGAISSMLNPIGLENAVVVVRNNPYLLATLMAKK